MPRDHINELTAFIAVARNQSFTRAANELGVTPSALSHTISGLEQRLNLRLLSRTTRNVSTTEHGEKLLRSVGPLMDQIAEELASVTYHGSRPAGHIRITCTDHTIETVFREKLPEFLRKYPEIKVELSMNYALVDIVAERFDAGIRIGEAIQQDMVTTRIGPDWRFSVVGSPSYFANRAVPKTPADLADHNCIQLRMASAGNLMRWEFRSPDGKSIRLPVEGQAIFTTVGAMRDAAIDGIGLAFLPQDLTAIYIRQGSLVEVLRDWCPLYDGHHLYYPSRRQTSPAFSAFLEAMRYRVPSVISD